MHINSKQILLKLKDTIWASKKRRIITCVGVCSIALCFVVICTFYINTQQPLALQVSSRTEGHPTSESLKIRFSQSLKNGVVLDLAPKTAGKWQMKSDLFGVRSAEFVPHGNSELIPATTYTVKLVHAKRQIVGKPISSQSTKIETEFAPGVSSVWPKPDTADIKTNAAIKVTFSNPRSENDMPKLNMEPTVELERVVSPDKKVFTWKPKQALSQTTAYVATILASESSDQKIATIPFSTVKQPSITAATNKEYFYENDAIVVDFGIEMTNESPAIKCECEGSGTWENPQKFVFKPTGIVPGKSYKYVVSKGLKSTKGGILEQDASYTVTTPGAVKTNVEMAGQSQLTSKAVLRFDQPIKRETLNGRVSVQPNATGNLVWIDDKTAQFNLSNLEHQTVYAVTVAPGVEPQKFGLPSGIGFSGRTTTVAQTIKLPVPVYRQAHPSSCEAASLRMALAFRGIHASDREIVQYIGYNPRSKDDATNSWDDPEEMYVGNIDAFQSNFGAYGAYAAPIAKAARSYGRSATPLYGLSPGAIAEQIHAGNPVIIIGTVTGITPRPLNWNGPNGVVNAWTGQHARTVVGVVGKPSAPLGFYVNDPYRGTHEYWSVARMITDLRAAGNKSPQGTVVY